MRKVSLTKIFAAKGGIIYSSEIPYRMDGEILMHNQRRDMADTGWLRACFNDDSYRLACKFNGIRESGVIDGLMPVREFEKMFGFSPKKEFIVDIA